MVTTKRNRSTGQIGRPRRFETDEAWDIYQALPEDQRTYENVAKELSVRYDLDPPLTGKAISDRFSVDKVKQKGRIGAPKLKTPLTNKERQRRKRLRKKELEKIANS